MATPPAIKSEAVHKILAGRPFPSIAKEYRVHPVTLKRWLRKYRQAGSDKRAFENACPIPHNRFTRNQEETVCRLKENEPGLTLVRAQRRLERLGLKICLASIQRIWREAGYADIPAGSPFPISAGTRRIISEAGRALTERKAFREAARLVNRLPACPELELLARIPDRWLSLRRRLDKLDAMRRVEPMPVFLRRCRGIRRKLERKEYYHSALQAGFVEASILTWLNHPKDGLALIRYLSSVTPGRLNRFIRFKLLYYQSRFLADMLRMPEAARCARQCGLLLKSLNRYDLEVRMSQLYSSLGEYGKARRVLERAMARPDAVVTRDERLSRAMYCAITGVYDTARSIIQRLPEPDDRYKSFYNVTLALCALGMGEPKLACDLSQKALSFARREGFVNHLQASVMVQSSAHAALGFAGQARNGIRKVIPLLAKHRARRDLSIHELLLKADCGPVRTLNFPPVKLLFRLKKAGQSGRPGDYNTALAFARKKGLLGIFHRYCLLQPEAVNRLLGRAIPVHLPRPLLRQPVFNRQLPSLRVDFLGPLRFFRNEQPIKARLRPKDAALFLHLLSARDFRLSVEECLRNFWPRAGDPMNNLYHLLRRLRRQLMIPAQYLYVKNRQVCYRGSGITDLRLFQESLNLARASAAAQENDFACQEYRRAFQLIRGEPFHLAYDQWSEELRSRILGLIEKAAGEFSRTCRSAADAADAVKLLAGISKMMPDPAICARGLLQAQAMSGNNT